MATEKQIAANRANAKRSTGPRTLAGKCRSKRNSYRHGLSRSYRDEIDILTTIKAVERFFVELVGDEQIVNSFIQSQYELLYIDDVRCGLLASLDSDTFEPKNMRRLAALDRYERRARTENRRLMRELERSIMSK